MRHPLILSFYYNHLDCQRWWTTTATSTTTTINVHPQSSRLAQLAQQQSRRIKPLINKQATASSKTSPRRERRLLPDRRNDASEQSHILSHADHSVRSQPNTPSGRRGRPCHHRTSLLLYLHVSRQSSEHGALQRHCRLSNQRRTHHGPTQRHREQSAALLSTAGQLRGIVFFFLENIYF